MFDDIGGRRVFHQTTDQQKQVGAVEWIALDVHDESWTNMLARLELHLSHANCF